MKEEVKNDKITLKDLNGKEIVVTPHEKGFTFSDEDKIVLVNFFATWCPPCKAEIPHLNNLQENTKTNLSSLVFFWKKKSNEEIANFAKYNNANFIITNGPDNFKFARAAGGVKNIPLMFLYDKNGNYSTHYVGAFVPEEMIDSDIKKVL